MMLERKITITLTDWEIDLLAVTLNRKDESFLRYQLGEAEFKGIDFLEVLESKLTGANYDCNKIRKEILKEEKV